MTLAPPPKKYEVTHWSSRLLGRPLGIGNRTVASAWRRTLFAALEIATGKVTGACKPRHRHQEFLAFLRQVARAYPEQELHLVMDNYATHKTTEVRSWLEKNPRIHVHFTPTSASWLNLVGVWFGIIERQAIHRGSCGSVKDLNTKIRAFINGWNDRCHPFVWTKPADEILKKANRQTTSNTPH